MSDETQQRETVKYIAEILSVLISLIALIVSINASRLTKKSMMPQVVSLGSTRDAYDIGYDQPRATGEVYQYATCFFSIRVANVGGVDTTVRDIDFIIYKGQQRIETRGLYDNNGGFDTIDKIEFTTSLGDNMSQPLSIPAHSTTTLVTEMAVEVPTNMYEIPNDQSYITIHSDPNKIWDSDPNKIWARIVVNFIDIEPLITEPIFCTTTKPK